MSRERCSLPLCKGAGPVHVYPPTIVQKVCKESYLEDRQNGGNDGQGLAEAIAPQAPNREKHGVHHCWSESRDQYINSRNFQLASYTMHERGVVSRQVDACEQANEVPRMWHSAQRGVHRGLILGIRSAHAAHVTGEQFASCSSATLLACTSSTA